MNLSRDARSASTRTLRPLAFLGVVILAPCANAQEPPSECPWQQVGDAPIPRIEGPSVVVDDKIYVLGGFYNDFLFATARVDVYHPATDTWTTAADMPMALTHDGVALDDRTIWVAGGFQGNHPGVVIDNVWKYDVDADVWSAGPSLPQRRGSGQLVREGRDLHYFGGVGQNKEIDRPDHWVLDLDNPTTWVPAAPLPNPRNHLGSAELGGKVYALGGQYRHHDDPEDVDLVHAYDPLTDTWTQVASLPLARSHFEPSCFAWNGRIIVAAGRANTIGADVVADVTAYDPVLDTWTYLLPLPVNRNAPTVKVVGDLMVVTSGGTGPSTPVAQTYVRPTDAVLGDTRRLNAGGGFYQTPGTPNEWCGDHDYVDGMEFANDLVTDVADTDDDELYRSEHSGTGTNPTTFGYRIAVHSGLYRVRLHFAEIYWGAPGGGAGGAGRRVFDVFLEDELVIDDLDLYDEVGPVTAMQRTFDLPILDDTVDLTFLASVDRPKISAIETIRLPDDAFENYCVAAPNSVGDGAEIWFDGNTSIASGDFTLTVEGAPPGQSALFIRAGTSAQFPFGAGQLCVSAPIYRLGPALSTSTAGTLERAIDYANPPAAAATIVPGALWHFQLWYRDGAVFNLSNGLAVRFTL